MAWSELKLLSDSGLQMGSSTSALYTTPEYTDVQVESINLWNGNTSTESPEIFVNGTTTACSFFKESLGTGVHREFYQNSPITLSPEEAIYGKSTTADKVNVRIYGRVNSHSTPPTTNMKGWWMSSKAYTGSDGGGTEITTDNTLIYSLADQSGNNYHLNQSNSSNQYTYKTNIINSYPSIYSSANTKFMSGANWSHSNHTFICVANLETWSHGAYLMTGGDDSTDSYAFFEYETNPSVKQYSNDGTTHYGTSVACSLDTWHLMMCTFNGSNSFVSLDDNSDVVSSNQVSPTSPGFSLGYFTSSTWSFVGHFAEVLLYSTPLASDSGDGLEVRQYLNNKYDLGFDI